MSENGLIQRGPDIAWVDGNAGEGLGPEKIASIPPSQLILAFAEEIHFHDAVERVDNPILADVGPAIIFALLAPLDIAAPAGQKHNHHLRWLAPRLPPTSPLGHDTATPPPPH